MAYDFAKQYLAYFDQVYKVSSKTAILETGKDKYKPLGADQILVNNLTVSGNYDYSRTTGYSSGSVSNAWTAYSLDMDRGLKLSVDAMDLEEARITASKIQDVYLKEKFFPELDKYRFSKIYSIMSGDGDVSSTNIASGTPTNDNVIELLDTGIAQLNDSEVPAEQQVIFMSETTYKALKGSGDFYKTKVITEKSTMLNREVESLDGRFIIRVPQSRFKTAYTFGEGSVTATGDNINFMIVHVPAILAVIKRSVLRIFTPDQNMDSDGFVMNSRQYHGLNIFTNTRPGIYIHKAS